MERLAAFVIVGLALVVAADIEQTSTIAIAFAYLILLVIAMYSGPTAFGRLSLLVTGKPTINSRGGVGNVPYGPPAP